MEIICLASGSTGNAYIIRNKATTLLVECGLTKQVLANRLIKHAIMLDAIDATIVTHSHGDHAAAAADLSGKMPIVASRETLDAVGIAPSARITIASWKQVELGRITIIAFDVDHDCPGALGFIFKDSDTGETILFINDTATVRWNFGTNKFDTIMIECNHISEILEKKSPVDRRSGKSHMSLEMTKRVLAGMDLTRTRKIYLMHISQNNGDFPRMIREIREATGRPTVACLPDGGTEPK